MKDKKGAGIKGFLLGVLVAVLAGSGILYLTYGINLFGGSGVITPDVIKKMSCVEKIMDARNIEIPDEDKMAEGIYAGMVASLEDPYAYYMTADGYDEFLESTSGSYKGIGVIMIGQLVDGRIKVDSTYPGTPGAMAGILPGDYIIEMDGSSLEGVTPGEFGQMVRKREDGEMTLLLLRDNEEIEVKLTPEEIIVPTLQYEMLEGQQGYMKITEFTDGTSGQFKEAYKTLKEQNMKGLIVDLRDNPGGLLDAVCDTLKQILPEGIIVYTEDRYGKGEKIYSEGETPIDIPMVVLVNENSASAAEIFAGAVKEYEVGTLVGKNTFGKGIVQSTFQMEDHSAVKLTTSRYYTPKGNNIHGTGIAPDVEVEAGEDDVDLQMEEAVKVLTSMME